MLGQNQKWKQSKTQAEFSMLIISLHLIITCRTCCHGFGSKLSPRLKWKTKKPQAEQSAETSTESYAPQDGVQQQRNPNGIQMAIQYRIAPFMYLWHLWYLWISIQQYSSIFDPCWVLSIAAYLCRVLKDQTTRWGGLQGLWEWDPTKPKFCFDESWLRQDSRSQSKARWSLKDLLW